MSSFFKTIIDFFLSYIEFRNINKRLEQDDEGLDDDFIDSVAEDVVPSQNRYCWCLDNGHGELTAGKRSPILPNGEQFLEWEANRKVVKGIIIKLKNKGITYYEIVPEVEVDNFLKGRVQRANNHPSILPKIFLSIHFNAGPGKWTSATGIETWYAHKSVLGMMLAQVFQRNIVDKVGLPNRKIKSKQHKQFYVLLRTNMPAVLTENGFYNNPSEVMKLMTEEYINKVIDAHVNAILEIEKNGL